MQQHLNTIQAAEYLGLSKRTLETWRLIGGNSRPKFKKFGNRVLYNISELEAWASEQTHTSTSDTELGDSNVF